MDDLVARLRSIEQELDARTYRAGPWPVLLAELRALPRSQRLALSADITRVSDKLHLRRGRRRLPFVLGIAAELLATAVGALLLHSGLESHSDAAVIAAAAIWGFTFQPLLKVGVGLLLGVRYSYAYVDGVPRFKMRYGTYLTAPRWARIALHLAGTIGTPLGVYLVWSAASPRLPVAARICGVIFWATLFNVSTFFLWLAGARSFVIIPLRMSSGGAAGQELLDALHGPGRERF